MSDYSISIDRQTLEDTISDLLASKELLIRERDNINNRISAISGRIQSLQAKLEQSSRNGAGKKQRLRKGEGMAAILKVLNPQDGLGLSQAQIAEKTGISGSTVFR